MVYLLHFDRPYHRAQHYIGYTANLEQRIYAHRHGSSGVRLINAVRKAGIGFRVVRTWEGDRSKERELKNHKKAADFCPICQAERREASG